jgi:hypothetical protein
MDTKTPKPEMPEETPEERERLLSRYSARDRWLIEDVLKAHPTLTAAEAIEHLRQPAVYRPVGRGPTHRHPPSVPRDRARDLVSDAMHKSVAEILVAKPGRHTLKDSVA